MGRKKQSRQIHRPGTLMDRRPVSPAMKARMDLLDWQADPERYAAKTWKQIKQWA